MLEVELYRQLADTVVGAGIDAVTVVDPHCLAGGLAPAAFERALVGRRCAATHRVGKLLMLVTDGPAVGIRFGMTGGLILDGVPAIEGLRYGPRVVAERWIRLRISFGDRGVLALHDPRRLARVVLEPDLSALGPDALTLTPAGLRSVLRGRDPGRGPSLKARLLDQARVAGIGNLLADEILWRAALSPRRPSGSLSDTELRRLHRNLTRTLGELGARGGSHTGDLMVARRPGGRCPKDGAELAVATVGGRTTYWCPAHQR
jgi:formamidopyrimidine-DNA glycosylase